MPTRVFLNPAALVIPCPLRLKPIARNHPVAWPVIHACTRRAAEEVYPITCATGDVIRAADHTQRYIGDIIVGTTAVGKAGGITRQSTQPLLVFRLCRRGAKIKP